jgi:hypothetical protein
MKCESCGADAGEQVATCASCGSRLLPVDAFDSEARALLLTLEERLKGEVTRRTDPTLFSAFLIWLATGPVTYLLLGQLTEMGVLGRICNALLVLAPGFLAFGWLIQLKQERAEEAIWNASIRAEIEAFLARKGLSPSEWLVLVRRLLPADSPLALRILRGP